MFTCSHAHELDVALMTPTCKYLEISKSTNFKINIEQA